MFSNDDLPTFERPMKANSGNDSSGHDSKSGALRSKMADEMFTIKTVLVLSHQISLGDTTNFPIAAVNTPQSRRFAKFENARQSR